MLLDALHTTMNPVLDAHLLVGDIEAELPFCVYRAVPEPVRDKTGITGYIYVVEVGIIDNNPDDVNNYTESLTTAMLAMAGTINETEIEKVLLTDESGFYYSHADNVYMNDLEFKVFTKNR